MTDIADGTAPNLVLRALAHPVRLRMLSLMWASPFGATGLASALGIGHGLATQHLRRLVDAELVELVEVRTKRGGQERLFQTVRGRVLSDRDDDAPLLAEALATNLRDRSYRRLPGPGVTVDADLWLSPEVWDRFHTDLTALVDWVHDQARSPAAPGVIPVALTLMSFRVMAGEGNSPSAVQPG